MSLFKELGKERFKPGRKSRKYAESLGLGDVVTDQVRTTSVPARKNALKKTGSIFDRPLLTNPFFLGGAEKICVMFAILFPTISRCIIGMDFWFRANSGIPLTLQLPL